LPLQFIQEQSEKTDVASRILEQQITDSAIDAAGKQLGKDGVKRKAVKFRILDYFLSAGTGR
jgi:hypothetical protein